MSRGYLKESESNPFYFDDDDNDDEGGLDNLNQIKTKIAKSESSQIQSLDRSRRVLQETEELGYKTAEELLHQGDQLKNAETKLDSINEMTTVSQRHLNSIKSVFGSLKNKFFSRSTEAPSIAKAEIQHSRLRETLDDEFGDHSVHPNSITTSSNKAQHLISDLQARRQYKGGATRLTNDDVSDEDEDEWDTLRDVSQTASVSRQNVMDEQLTDISASLGRLKQLGLGMNDELKKQDEQLHRLTEKTDKSVLTIADQNKQMKKLLK